MRRTFVAIAAAMGGALATRPFALAQTDPNAATETPERSDMATPAPQTGYAPVNGLKM